MDRISGGIKFQRISSQKLQDLQELPKTLNKEGKQKATEMRVQQQLELNTQCKKRRQRYSIPPHNLVFPANSIVVGSENENRDKTKTQKTNRTKVRFLSSKNLRKDDTKDPKNVGRMVGIVGRKG